MHLAYISGNGSGLSFILLPMQCGFAASSAPHSGELPQSQPQAELQAKHEHPPALLITYFLLQLLPYSYQGSVYQGLYACPRDLTMTLHLKYFCGIE